MNRETRTRRVLGVIALVLGLIGLSAGGAQAEAGAKWTVGGTDAGTLKAGVQITTLIGGKAALLTKIGGAKVALNTSKSPELLGVKLEGEGKLTTGSEVKFKGVTTELNGKVSTVCALLELPNYDFSLGETITHKLKGELVLHEAFAGNRPGVVRILPEIGNVFATLLFGEECSLPAEVPLITKKAEGKGIVLTDPLGIGNELVEHEISELPKLTELWAISETEEHRATVDGTASFGLLSHGALKWKGMPG